MNSGLEVVLYAEGKEIRRTDDQRIWAAVLNAIVNGIKLESVPMNRSTRSRKS